MDETTKQFDKDTQSLTEEQITAEAAKNDAGSSGVTPGKRYTAEYRHFDTLIWQLPAWCTAIFLVTAVGTNSIQQATFLSIATGLTTNQFATGFLGLMFLVILALSQALYRFRRHQAALKRYRTTSVWSSASTYLQLIVTVEALALLFVVLLINGVLRGQLALHRPAASADHLQGMQGTWSAQYQLKGPASDIFTMIARVGRNAEGGSAE